MHTSTAVIVVRSELRYSHCKLDLYCEQRRSATWRIGMERRFYDDHDRMVNGSIPNLVSLLRPGIRHFTIGGISLIGGIWQAAN